MNYKPSALEKLTAPPRPVLRHRTPESLLRAVFNVPEDEDPSGCLFVTEFADGRGGETLKWPDFVERMREAGFWGFRELGGGFHVWAEHGAPAAEIVRFFASNLEGETADVAVAAYEAMRDLLDELSAERARELYGPPEPAERTGYVPDH